VLVGDNKSIVKMAYLYRQQVRLKKDEKKNKRNKKNKKKS